MKRILFFLSCLYCLSSMATIARLAALGQPTGLGSFYLTDNRSIFRNPAKINQLANQTYMEWGTASRNDSTEDRPHAEGGVIAGSKKWKYGFYFGNEFESLNAKRTDALGVTGEAGFLPEDNPLPD